MEDQENDLGHIQEISIVEKEGDFFRFLLTTSTVQAKALLKNLSHSQTNAIGEIFQNILYSDEVDEDVIRTLKGKEKWKNLVRKAGDERAAVRTRKALIKSHALMVLKILKLVEDILPL